MAFNRVPTLLVNPEGQWKSWKFRKCLECQGFFIVVQGKSLKAVFLNILVISIGQ